MILGAPKAVSRSACPLETQRTLPAPGNSDRDRIFRLYNYCVFKGHYLASFLGSQTTERPQNDLRTTSERHRDFSQNDHLSTKTHRPQTIHPMCAAFQVIDLTAICSTHGLIFPVTLSNFSAMFQNGPAMGLEMDRNGYDIADSSSDVDATSSIVQTVQNQAPRQKYEDHRLKITWFACGITIYKPVFFSSLGFMVDIPNYLMGVINQQTFHWGWPPCSTIDTRTYGFHPSKIDHNPGESSFSLRSPSFTPWS